MFLKLKFKKIIFKSKILSVFRISNIGVKGLLILLLATRTTEMLAVLGQSDVQSGSYIEKNNSNYYVPACL